MKRNLLIILIFILAVLKLNGQDIKSEGTLPVQLIYFYANAFNDSIVIKWGTATETENYGYDLERSINSLSNFQFISFINGNGNSNSPKFYSYTDTLIDSNKTYYYRLKQIDTNGDYRYSDTVTVNYLTSVKDEQIIIYNFTLYQNYPNPFNPETNISFQIMKSAQIKLLVYNSLGQLIETLIDDELEAGDYNLKFDGENLSSGVYFYQLAADKFSLTRMMILNK